MGSDLRFVGICKIILNIYKPYLITINLGNDYRKATAKQYMAVLMG